MKILNRPEYIGLPDWQILLEKYDGLLPDKVIKQLNNNYPIQYLIGNVEFYNSILEVNESVLIPRFETELLIDKVVALINNKRINPKSIIDLGTGSGAIAISLCKEFNTKVDAIDISEEALKVAFKNTQKNNVKVNLLKQDMLSDDIEFNHTLIISNPPYVSFNEITGPETKYEPQNAIFADDEGLIFYKRIIELSKNNIEKEFTICFEIGATQKDDIIKLINKAYPGAEIIAEKDLTNRDRYIFAFISK